jgi:hypothetical protein
LGTPEARQIGRGDLVGGERRSPRAIHLHQAEGLRIGSVVRLHIRHLVDSDALCTRRDLQAERLEDKERLFLLCGAREIGVGLGDPNGLMDAVAVHHGSVVGRDVVDLLGLMEEVERGDVEVVAVLGGARLFD